MTQPKNEALARFLTDAPVTRQNLNTVYNSQKITALPGHIVDQSFSLAQSVDSFGGINVVQPAAGPVSLTPPAGSPQIVDMQRFPGANGAYVHLSSIQMTSQDLTLPSVVQILVSYAPPGPGGNVGKMYPLFIFDSRPPYGDPVLLDLTFPVLNLDPGLPNIGALQFQVLATTAAGAHAVTYNIVLQAQILYQVDDPPATVLVGGYVAALIHKLEEMATIHRGIRGLFERFLEILPGYKPKDEQ